MKLIFTRHNAVPGVTTHNAVNWYRPVNCVITSRTQLQGVRTSCSCSNTPVLGFVYPVLLLDLPQNDVREFGYQSPPSIRLQGVKFVRTAPPKHTCSQFRIVERQQWQTTPNSGSYPPHLILRLHRLDRRPTHDNQKCEPWSHSLFAPCISIVLLQRLPPHKTPKGAIGANMGLRVRDSVG